MKDFSHPTNTAPVQLLIVPSLNFRNPFCLYKHQFCTSALFGYVSSCALYFNFTIM